VLAFDTTNEVDQRVLKGIKLACDAAMTKLNATNSLARINEVSSHFEDTLRELLNSTAGPELRFSKDWRRKNATFRLSGLAHLISERVFYLDAKLYAQGSRDSSFRTFYFEPKLATNKVRDDAVHLIVGFEHEPKDKVGGWKFTRWDVVDLSNFKVKLKAEVQGSNRDM
jgi:hypothetical protein